MRGAFLQNSFLLRVVVWVHIWGDRGRGEAQHILSKFTSTAIGRFGGAWPSWYNKWETVPAAPLHRPTSCHRFAINITCLFGKEYDRVEAIDIIGLCGHGHRAGVDLP